MFNVINFNLNPFGSVFSSNEKQTSSSPLSDESLDIDPPLPDCNIKFTELQNRIKHLFPENLPFKYFHNEKTRDFLIIEKQKTTNQLDSSLENFEKTSQDLLSTGQNFLRELEKIEKTVIHFENIWKDSGEQPSKSNDDSNEPMTVSSNEEDDLDIESILLDFSIQHTDLQNRLTRILPNYLPKKHLDRKNDFITEKQKLETHLENTRKHFNETFPIDIQLSIRQSFLENLNEIEKTILLFENVWKENEELFESKEDILYENCNLSNLLNTGLSHETFLEACKKELEKNHIYLELDSNIPPIFQVDKDLKTMLLLEGDVFSKESLSKKISDIPKDLILPKKLKKYNIPDFEEDFHVFPFSVDVDSNRSKPNQSECLQESFEPLFTEDEFKSKVPSDLKRHLGRRKILLSGNLSNNTLTVQYEKVTLKL